MPLSDLTGYGAIWYVRQGEPSIHVARISDGGELSIAIFVRDKVAIGTVFASTEEAIENAATALGAKAYIMPTRVGVVYALDANSINRTNERARLRERSSESRLAAYLRDVRGDRGVDLGRSTATTPTIAKDVTIRDTGSCEIQAWIDDDPWRER
jgi:hypothetical protein